MAYSKDYFQLQLDFANKIAQITQTELTDVLLDYTSFYKTFRIPGWDFDINNQTWQEFIKQFNQNDNKLLVINNFYLEQVKKNGEKNDKKLFGCFSYEYDMDKKAVSIHFRNTDTPEPGALSKERLEQRITELTQMFTEIKKEHPEAQEVRGRSWLYNLNSYTRLFPPEYMQNHSLVTDWFKSTAIWGQFLDSSGSLKIDLAKAFEKCVATKETAAELKECFPLKLIKPCANIKFFYDFYGV